MNCPKCGKYNLEQSIFCENCGTNLKEIQNIQNTNNIAMQNENPIIKEESEANTQKKSNNLLNKKRIIPIIIVAIIIAAILIILPKKGKKQKENIDINYSTSFFIRDENNKYALFNDDGKKLTDFIFTSVNDFINDATIVKKDNEYGIIDSNGKMVADFGKYRYINQVGGLFKAENSEYDYFLVDGKGNVLYDLEDIDLVTYIAEKRYFLLEDNNNKTYKILNYKGKEIASFPINSSVEKEPTTSEKDGYASIYYDNKNYIFDPIEGKLIASFEANSHYCINGTDGDIFVLNSCTSMFERQDETFYKFIKDGKVYDTTEKCNRIYYDSGNVICFNGTNRNIIDTKLNLGLDISNKAYIDNNNYAMNKNGTISGVDFYNNENVIKNAECRKLIDTGYMKNGLYLLSTIKYNKCGIEPGMYEYYKSNGEVAFGKTFKSASLFDKNGLAKVSEDGEKYYLMDSNGKKVSDEYSDITANLDYYVVTNNNLKGIISENGKSLVDCKYSQVSIIGNHEYALLTTPDSKYVLYNLETKNQIKTFDEMPGSSEHYLTITKNGVKQYYTYSGKMFYESK